MNYRVMIVPDHALPADVKRVMVERSEDPPLLVIADSVAGTCRFVQEWEQVYSTADASHPALLRAV